MILYMSVTHYQKKMLYNKLFTDLLMLPTYTEYSKLITTIFFGGSILL